MIDIGTISKIRSHKLKCEILDQFGHWKYFGTSAPKIMGYELREFEGARYIYGGNLRYELTDEVYAIIQGEPKEKSFSLYDAAVELDVRPRTLRAWIAEGKIDAQKDAKSGRIYIKESELAKYGNKN